MILVTGATGKSGREIVRQLSQTGVRSCADWRRRETSAREGVEIAAGDLKFAREHAR